MTSVDIDDVQLNQKPNVEVDKKVAEGEKVKLVVEPENTEDESSRDSGVSSSHDYSQDGIDCSKLTLLRTSPTHNQVSLWDIDSPSSSRPKTQFDHSIESENDPQQPYKESSLERQKNAKIEESSTTNSSVVSSILETMTTPLSRTASMRLRLQEAYSQDPTHLPCSSSMSNFEGEKSSGRLLTSELFRGLDSDDDEDAPRPTRTGSNDSDSDFDNNVDEFIITNEREEVAVVEHKDATSTVRRLSMATSQPLRRTQSDARTMVRKRGSSRLIDESPTPFEATEKKRSKSTKEEDELFDASLLDEVFSPDDLSPNSTIISYCSTTSTSTSTRIQMRAQSTGVLNNSPMLPQSLVVNYRLEGVERPQVESQAFRSISAETLLKELTRLGDAFNETYTLIDCRYPYEYQGGHVKHAINMSNPEGLVDTFFINRKPNPEFHKRIPIFYCEYSQKRGPSIAHGLRSLDRMIHTEEYPKVAYKEMYLLDRGYRNFWSDGKNKEHCTPPGYVAMLEKSNEHELKKFRMHRSKSSFTLSKGNDGKVVPTVGFKRASRITKLTRHESLNPMVSEEVASPTSKLEPFKGVRLMFDSPDRPEDDDKENRKEKLPGERTRTPSV